MSGRAAYLVHLLVWAAPVIAGQLGVLAWRGQAGAALRAGAPPALAVAGWLFAADAVAVDAGIWRFPPGLHLGVTLLGVPVEELLFFVLSSLMAVLGYALFLGRGRA